jgi:hypothetical protein
MPARDKHSSFLQSNVNYDPKMFYTLGPSLQQQRRLSKQQQQQRGQHRQPSVDAGEPLSDFLLSPDPFEVTRLREEVEVLRNELQQAEIRCQCHKTFYGRKLRLFIIS